MAMKTATTVAGAGPRGLRSVFSTLSTNSSFPSQPTTNRPQPQPSTNLFISGTSSISFYIIAYMLFFHLDCCLCYGFKIMNDSNAI